jgi:hypothetical protein
VGSEHGSSRFHLFTHFHHSGSPRDAIYSLFCSSSSKIEKKICKTSWSASSGKPFPPDWWIRARNEAYPFLSLLISRRAVREIRRRMSPQPRQEKKLNNPGYAVTRTYLIMYAQKTAIRPLIKYLHTYPHTYIHIIDLAQSTSHPPQEQKIRVRIPPGFFSFLGSHSNAQST